MRLFYRILDFILYSHLFIVVCAVSTVYLTTRYFCCFQVELEYYLFAGFGTLLIYNLHRLFSLYKIYSSDLKVVRKRFEKVEKLQLWYVLTSILAVLICSYTFFLFPWRMQVLLVLPCLLSLFYILPIFPKHKRLRDFNFLKIFLIAICWPWLCTVLPLQYSDLSTGIIAALGMEKFFFFFAIALPFDFRDVYLDEEQSVQTIVSRFGYRNAMLLDLLSLLISISILGVLTFQLEIVTQSAFYGILIAYVCIALLVSRAFLTQNDYYYDVFIDGGIILVLLWVMYFQYLMG